MLLLPHWLKIVVRSPEARLVPSAADPGTRCIAVAAPHPAANGPQTWLGCCGYSKLAELDACPPANGQENGSAFCSYRNTGNLRANADGWLEPCYRSLVGLGARLIPRHGWSLSPTAHRPGGERIAIPAAVKHVSRRFWLKPFNSLEPAAVLLLPRPTPYFTAPQQSPHRRPTTHVLT